MPHICRIRPAKSPRRGAANPSPPSASVPRPTPKGRGAALARLACPGRVAVIRHALAVLSALVVAGLPAPAAASSRSCAAGDALCLEALPADAAWEQAIGLDAVPNRYQGDGVTVASIDTGVRPTPNLGARLLARVDLTGEGDGLDRFGHGTHMAGLIAGNGTTSSEAFEGAAPEARLVSVKVAGWDGATDVSSVIAGLRWVVSNRDRFGIRVVNLSWGTDAVRGSGEDPLNLAVERAWRAGLVVVVSAGNTGPAAGTVAKPGDDPYVITVGAADTNGTATPADDAVAPFSSRGPTPDGAGKPDVLAPGVSLVSDRAPGSTVDTFRPAARVGLSHFKGTGTSQASAVVAGVAARLLEADPALTNDQVKGVLVATADPALAGPGGGAGVVDAAAAVAAVAPERHAAAPPEPPSANARLVPATGRGALDASRGTQRVYGDLDGDGTPELLAGEVDVLGSPWDAGAYADERWDPATWAASAWARVTAENAGAARPTPQRGPVVAWEPADWGARSALQAGWDARYWGARYWGARYWGARYWGSVLWP
ncbi:MAG: serine protease AprX [Solirubrobacteraceae bacterium]|nr:serine protease AprX [Solirubrobacteraceae bacterium]